MPLRRCRQLAPLAAALLALPLAGCQAAELLGGMLQSYQRTGTRTVFPEYEGLRGKSYAVLVSAPPAVRAEYPSLTGRLTNTITGLLAGNNDAIGATSYLGGPIVQQFQFTTPAWESWSYGELAETLAVERLIIVDVFEFQLYEPGNQYLWDGRIAVRVGVVEADSVAPNDFAYTKDLVVRFPDGTGYTPTDFSLATVTSQLQARICNRVAWLFYQHEEDNDIDY